VEKLAPLRQEWSRREAVRHRRAARSGERWENASQCEELTAMFVTILKRAKTP
jgi:hypothetical protein